MSTGPEPVTGVVCVCPWTDCVPSVEAPNPLPVHPSSWKLGAPIVCREVQSIAFPDAVMAVAGLPSHCTDEDTEAAGTAPPAGPFCDLRVCVPEHEEALPQPCQRLPVPCFPWPSQHVVLFVQTGNVGSGPGEVPVSSAEDAGPGHWSHGAGRVGWGGHGLGSWHGANCTFHSG